LHSRFLSEAGSSRRVSCRLLARNIADVVDADQPARLGGLGARDTVRRWRSEAARAKAASALSRPSSQLVSPNQGKVREGVGIGRSPGR